VSDTTFRARRDEWTEAGVFEKLPVKLLPCGTRVCWRSWARPSSVSPATNVRGADER
jgi:hypothetical protein